MQLKFERQKTAQPVGLGPSPMRNILNVICPRSIPHTAAGSGSLSTMSRLLRIAPVLEPFEYHDHRRRFFRLHRSTQKPGKYTKQANVGCDFASA